MNVAFIPFFCLLSKNRTFTIVVSKNFMPHIAIISSSIRPGRKSHRVALYFEKYLKDNDVATTEILDLQEYAFPMFDEILEVQKNPLPSLVEFAEKITAADGIIMVFPEYNGAPPASLKNVIDVLYEEWYHKPVALASVSTGILGGVQGIVLLQFSLWKIRAMPVPAMFPVPTVQKAFDTTGVPTDKEDTDKRAQLFFKEMLWCIEANKRMAEGG
jgi:NAD(P)H-dependent FMN reductase